MSTPPFFSSSAIRDRFVADHRDLDVLFTRLLAYLEASDREAIERVWAEFDDLLTRHLEAEENFMIPQLFAAHPRDASALLEEHRHIRSRLVELGFGVDRPLVRVEATRGFVEELRAHAHHEEDVLYQWADEHLLTRAPGALLDALTALD
jgi:hemerythrin superfamily protein